MPNKLPPDFDPDRYATAYPDVALSGLSAGDHYLRFGKLLGRNPSGKGAGVSASPAPSQAAPKRAETVSEEATRAEPTETPRKPSKPIVDRPADFNPADIVLSPAPPKPGSKGGKFELEYLARGKFRSPAERTELLRNLQSYARLFSLDVPLEPYSEEAWLSGLGLVRDGDARIENAWFAEPLRIRLMLSGATSLSSEINGWALRAYQADPADPETLQLAGPGVQFPRVGPTFHDLELVHSLMPVLIELTDAEGFVREISLWPFPSLLPGGLHAAELKALQAEPNPMDAYWSLSEMLLRETIGESGAAERSISSLRTDETDDRESSADVHAWLRAVFGLGLASTDTKAGGSRLSLSLPAGSVPTISALASRRLELAGQEIVGPYLVVDQSTRRPRWAVSLPPTQAAAAGLPQLTQSGRRRSKSQQAALPVPLSIIFRREAETVIPRGAEPERGQAALPPLTVVVESSDPARTESLVSNLREVLGGVPTELLIRIKHAGERPGDALPDHLCKVPFSLDLRDLARSATHEWILTVDDRVEFGPALLEELYGQLQANERAASSSCLLLGEKVFKKQTVLEPASGGLFPGSVSFAASPRLGFHEPDVGQALPDLTYPVVANTLMLTMWSTKALAGLTPLTGPIPPTAADIRLGLDLLEAGYTNLCTSTVKAVLRGHYSRRDAIDPVGSVYLQPKRWEEIFDQVTVIRELF